MKINLKQSKTNKSDVCLGIQWIPSPSSLLPSGLYWVPLSCQKIGGYVCKIPNRCKLLNFANTIYVLIRYFGSVFERVYRVWLAETILLIAAAAAAAAGRVLFARVSKIKGVPSYVERV